ncbi:MAG: beta-ketoacyl synthase [Flavobacteriales bacterium]|nr:MAG: beta-ketoacyl synthase [Flavobacteriales bacterium]
MTYIGSENIISPLGDSARENFIKVKNNETGISLFSGIGVDKEDLYLSKIGTLSDNNKFDVLLAKCLDSIIKESSDNIINSKDTIVILSTTKADIQENLTAPIQSSVEKIKVAYKLHHTPLVISNACISGVLAMNTANNFIQSNIYKHAFVIGADVISDFVLFGFQSLYAISNEVCQPFDKERKGISLGEGAAGVLMSSESSVFKKEALEFVEGTSSNDANHISGPSRTGEGLYRTVQKTMELANIKSSEIDFISAHGTGTLFNDEMESIAFDRLNMNNIPLNSLKGYFGHTLGAAGLIETAISMQSIRTNTLVKSLGFEAEGTSGGINILTQNLEKEVSTILKTASGFGGCNASAIIRNI